MYTSDEADQLTSLRRGTISAGAIATRLTRNIFRLTATATSPAIPRASPGPRGSTRRGPEFDERDRHAENNVGDTAAPEYDAAGNENETPSAARPPPAPAIQVNGWNKVTNMTGTGVDISYRYDGSANGRADDNLAATATAATIFYYFAGPQMIQSVHQQPASPADGTKTETDQYVFSPRYVNVPILDTQTVLRTRLHNIVVRASATYYFSDRRQLQRQRAFWIPAARSSSAMSTPRRDRDGLFAGLLD